MSTNTDMQRLEEKVDKLACVMEAILQKLETATIIAKEPIVPLQKKRTKAQERQESMNQFKQDFRLKYDHGFRLQREFNLLTVPSADRIKHYLQTRDPKAFDGLKRVGQQSPKYRGYL